MPVQAGEGTPKEKVKYGKLTKLGSVPKPFQHPSHAKVDVGEEFEGDYPRDPEVGERFQIYAPFTDYRGTTNSGATSEVKFIYNVDEESSSEGYVAYEELWPVLEVLDTLPLRSGDVLFTTLNSIYWLKRKD